MFDSKRKNHKIYFGLLVIIIAVQLFRLCYVFAVQKENLHLDEVWSFGLSNSYYKPFIFMSSEHNESIEYININEWISGQDMKDYLTVRDDQRFSYDSVYYNQVHDYHPFLYYYILHTICSFFPSEFSTWYGFVINIFANIITVIFVYKLAFVISKSQETSILCCAFYSFSMGALDTFIFLRMYALLTMISIVSLYLHAKIYYTGNIKRYLFWLFIVTVAGCLTQHFYLPYAGVISVCFCIYYFIKKRMKSLVIYAFTMLGAVAVSLLLFPATIDHVFSGRINDEPKYIFSWQLKLTLNCMTKELFGIGVPVVPKYSFTANMIAVICITAIISPLFFLFRKEEWFKKAIYRIKNVFIKIISRIVSVDLMMLTLTVSSVSVLILTAVTVSLIAMGVFTDRYIFMIYPNVCIITVILISKVSYIFLNNYKRVAVIAMVVICGLFCFRSNNYISCYYLFQKPEDAISAKEYIRNADCIFITTSLNYPLLTSFTKEAMDASYIYPTTDDDLIEKISSIPSSPDNTKEKYYYVDASCFQIAQSESDESGLSKIDELVKSDQSVKITLESFLKLLNERYSSFEYIGYDVLFGHSFYLYKVEE